MIQPLVAVTADRRHFDKYDWHAAPHQYLEAALAVAGVLPVIVPAFGARIDFDALLDTVDGVMTTGSKTNVHPALYGGDTDERHGPYDTDRDATAIALMRGAIGRGVPLLAICRGMQELNVALGGTLEPELQEVEGRLDHRAPEGSQDERFAIRQDVEVAPGTCLAGIVGDGAIRVNSVHRQGIGQLASGLVPEALASDGTVEAVSVAGARAFAVGVQWHPEYWAASDETSARIFRAFGAAVHGHQKTRAEADR